MYKPYFHLLEMSRTVVPVRYIQTYGSSETLEQLNSDQMSSVFQNTDSYGVAERLPRSLVARGIVSVFSMACGAPAVSQPIQHYFCAVSITRIPCIFARYD